MNRKHPLKSALRLTVFSATVFALNLVGNSPALAWGADGHNVIAILAQAHLTPAARKEVERLLAQEPGATMATISTWADEHRNPATAAWHYVNFPRDTCTYDTERDCPGGACVVEAIKRQTKVLESGATDSDKLLALKYLVHFVGDVHQPLHAGYQDDKGGNTYQLQAFMRGSNLHALWDTGIIRSLNQDVEAMSTRLLPTTMKVTEFSPATAAQESCQIVGSPGYYPDRQVGQDYIDKFLPTLEQRLSLAGARLAALLNRVLR